MDIPDLTKPAAFEEKVKSAEELIIKKLAEAKDPFVCFSGGKRSTVLLHMVKKLSSGKVNAILVDTGVQFDNIIQYANKMDRLWQVNLEVERPLCNIVPGIDREDCCRKLICDPLAGAASKYGIDLLFIGLYKDKTNGLAKGLSSLGDTAAYPLWHFTDDDVRGYIKKYNIPICSLYEKGYLAIDCAPCSARVEAISADDEAAMKEKLKKLGYV